MPATPAAPHLPLSRDSENARPRLRCNRTNGFLRAIAGVGVSFAAVFALAACSSAAPAASRTSLSSAAPSATRASTTTTSAAETAAAITVKGFRYMTPASVAPGAMITVTNGDSENHTVTADSTGGFDVKAPAGASVTFAAPSKPGTYQFHCTYHANMHGVLIVR